MLFFAKLLRPQASLNCGVLDGLLTGNHEIFHNRRRIEQADILKRSCNTDFADLICPQIGYILPEYFYLSAAKRNHSGNKVEQRRLSCSVGTNDSVNFVFFDLNGYPYVKFVDCFAFKASMIC